uniref:GH18 domain-containing protein n=1 Tax=Kalanchoe fedtschenkoi TaxID=63787 RepID=A0A7N1A6E6_KALFE
MAGRSRRFQSLMVVIGAAAGVLAGQEMVGVYWGQNGNEGSLDQACASGLYSFVTLAFLTTFGNGRNPVLNLAGHCDPSGGGCVSMGASIERCQRLGVKVLLSIGGGNGNYSLNSPADAIEDQVVNNSKTYGVKS